MSNLYFPNVNWKIKDVIVTKVGRTKKVFVPIQRKVLRNAILDRKSWADSIHLTASNDIRVAYQHDNDGTNSVHDNDGTI